MVTKVHKTSDGMEIPDYAYEEIASCLLPIIQRYYQTEAGKRAFAEWKAKQSETDGSSDKEINKGEVFSASPLSRK